MRSYQNQIASYRLSRTTWFFISTSRHVCFILVTTDQLSLLWHACYQTDNALLCQMFIEHLLQARHTMLCTWSGRQQNIQNLRQKKQTKNPPQKPCKRLYGITRRLYLLWTTVDEEGIRSVRI